MAADTVKERSYIPELPMQKFVTAFNLVIRRNEVFTSSIAHDKQRFGTFKVL